MGAVQRAGPAILRGGLLRCRGINQIIIGLEDLQAGATPYRTACLFQVFIGNFELGCTVGAAGLVLGGHGFRLNCYWTRCNMLHATGFHSTPESL